MHRAGALRKKELETVEGIIVPLSPPLPRYNYDTPHYTSHLHSSVPSYTGRGLRHVGRSKGFV